MAAVLPAVDPRTGNVLAMATSKRYGVNATTRDHSHTSLPIFTEYSAQGASTYKLFPLLTALQIGVPRDWPLETPPTATGYHPSNCTTPDAVTNADAQEFYAPNEGLASATAKSSNTYFVGLADQLLGCDLQPIVDMANKLGMKSLSLPSGDGRLSVQQTIIQYGRPGELVLGDIGTSPLELAGAYAAVANNGKFNAPAPILSITDKDGKSIAVKRSPGVQVVSPQIALQAIDILAGDTVAPGTSAAQFQPWYQQGLSVVAGKTGTSVAVVNGKDSTKNASLWFVGMTPDLVATSAVINFDHPNAPAAGLPGVLDAATDAYGAYAAGVWLRALTPSLASRHWAWTPPSQAPGEVVPSVIGMDLATAKQTLISNGYRVSLVSPSNPQLLCPSKAVPFNQIAFYGPQIAPKGTAITLCPSSGVSQTIFVPPPPPPPPKTKPPVTRTIGVSPVPAPTRTRPGGR